MINRGQTHSNGNTQSSRTRKPYGLPFLTVEQATHSPQPGVIVAARLENDNFRQGQQVVALRLEFKGQHWILNLRSTNPNLNVLCDAWGEDETTWAGRGVGIYVEEDDFNSKSWLRLDPVDEEPESAPAAPVAAAAKQLRRK